MAQFREIPVPPDAKRVRLELSPNQVEVLALIGIKRNLAVSAVARLALGLLVRGVPVTEDEVLREADRVRGEYLKVNPPPDAKEKKPVGRPPMAKPDDPIPPQPKRPRGRPKKGGA